ncbi:hypothetical protein PENTCL1PPCAC_6414 [Pristionchus entomophagus]|uniref:Uncharacterized protein n=1 Tax=Pristionchus entomophagus TaxID=358040 RepID=A0AAV5SSA9_9BILA|nr:hypothetical protein PENTCL1PPCAC_6414 [Pristionchus entomophagus]
MDTRSITSVYLRVYCNFCGKTDSRAGHVKDAENRIHLITSAPFIWNEISTGKWCACGVRLRRRVRHD